MSKQARRQTVLVTGASSGIGQGIAIAFGEQGANVVINYYNDEAGAADTLEKVSAGGGRGMICKADVSEEDEVLRMFREVKETFGGLDVLVNNAGIQDDNSLTDMTLKQWENVMGTNLTGHFLCAREAVRQFGSQEKPEQEGQARGNIIFISSVHDIIPWAGHINYAASKGGVSMLMKSLALEVAAQKIRVNCISPGAIATDINDEVWKDKFKMKDLLELIPYKRIGTPEDIARVAVFLASPASDYITGSTIYVDGGMTLYPGFLDNG